MSKQQQWMRNRAGGPLHQADISCESNECWPVAVIDVEDREQVERLAVVINKHDTHADDDSEWVDDLAAALREFANPKPPKPDEPKGLGAVVATADGGRWTRANEAGEWFSADGREVVVNYAGLHSVTAVLSEGVQP